MSCPWALPQHHIEQQTEGRWHHLAHLQTNQHEQAKPQRLVTLGDRQGKEDWRRDQDHRNGGYDHARKQQGDEHEQQHDNHQHLKGRGKIRHSGTGPGTGQKLIDHTGIQDDEKHHPVDLDRGQQRQADHLDVEHPKPGHQKQDLQHTEGRRFCRCGNTQQDQPHHHEHHEPDGQKVDRDGAQLCPARNTLDLVLRGIVRIAGKTARIDAKTCKIAELAARTSTAGKLRTMPGVGPMTALATQPGSWIWTRSADHHIGRQSLTWLHPKA